MSDVDVLTLPQALNYTTGAYVREEIFERQQNTLFVQIGPDDFSRNPKHLHAFAQSISSLNLVVVGVLEKTRSQDFSDLANGFDILITNEPDDGISVTVPDINASILNLSQCITRNPHASVALAQLLRQKAFTSIEKGFVLESMTYAMLQGGPEHADWIERRGALSQPISESPIVYSLRNNNQLDIFLNNPERANAFSSTMRDQLFEILQVAFFDQSIEKISLRGKGKSFCSGGELAEFGSVTSPPEAHLIRLSRNPGMSFHHLSDKTIAYLHGTCAGAGIEIPAFASKIVVDESVNIFLPEIAMGLIPGAGGTVSLPRRIGRQRTAYLAVTGDSISSEAALQWGLVDEVLSTEFWS